MPDWVEASVSRAGHSPPARELSLMNTGTSVLGSLRGFRFRSRPHQDGRERNGKHLGDLLPSSHIALPPGGQVDGRAVGAGVSGRLPERLRVDCAPLSWRCGGYSAPWLGPCGRAMPL